MKGSKILFWIVMLMLTNCLMSMPSDKVHVRSLLNIGGNEIIQRMCDESLTEPITIAVCVEWEDKPGYLDTNCFNTCCNFCDMLDKWWESLICKAGCSGGCWVPGGRDCTKYETITIYPCNQSM
ncbi:MAG: hypothetical protein J7L34_01190 [Thermotogaceae bacterium]|nr:hypothetical protein [Thermotogaceae bacterium]